MANHLTPLEVTERLIGQPAQIAGVLGIDPKAPYQWRPARGDRAAGDLPKVAYIRALLAHSDAHGLGLTAQHLIYGAPRAEIDEILSRRAAPSMAAE